MLLAFPVIAVFHFSARPLRGALLPLLQLCNASTTLLHVMTTTTVVLRPFVRVYPGEPVPEERFTNPPSWSSSNLYHHPGEPVPEETLTTHHPDPHPIFIIFFHLLRSIASSVFKSRAWQSFAQPLSMSSLVYLLVWSPSPHIPYISSPNHCLLFVTHAHIYMHVMKMES